MSFSYVCVCISVCAHVHRCLCALTFIVKGVGEAVVLEMMSSQRAEMRHSSPKHPMHPITEQLSSLEYSINGSLTNSNFEETES